MSFPDGDADDQRLRYAAGQIQQRHPYWLVFYGSHSRKIWAYPVFNVPRAPISARKTRPSWNRG